MSRDKSRTLYFPAICVFLLLLRSSEAAVEDPCRQETRAFAFQIVVDEDLFVNEYLLGCYKYVRTIKGRDPAYDFIIEDGRGCMTLVNPPETDALRQLSLSAQFDFDITCIDGITVDSLELNVRNINDETPQFRVHSYDIEVDEFTPIGTSVFNANPEVSDLDGTQIDSFNLYMDNTNSTRFSMVNGIVQVNERLDFETVQEYDYVMVAQDQQLHRGNAYLFITIRDSDDLPPAFSQPSYRVTIEENGKMFTSLGSATLQLRAFDQDSFNEPVYYEVLNGVNVTSQPEGFSGDTAAYIDGTRYFYMDYTTGDMSILNAFDRENMPGGISNPFALTIKASQRNDPSKSAIATVIVEILNLDDQLPEFTQSIYTSTIEEEDTTNSIRDL